jgi:5-methylcytosine-specific restriction endonuclease McrA
MLPDSACPALVLNADLLPLTTSPLSVFSWKDAVRASMTDNFEVLDRYEQTVRSPNLEIRLPSVLLLRNYVSNNNRPATLTRWNLFLAHRFRCAMCNKRFRSEDLTFEHVIPQSRGGKSTWSNLVPACEPCNSKKGNRTPAEAVKIGIVFRNKPYHPTRAQLNAIGAEFLKEQRVATKEWLSWLYWEYAEIDP